MNERFKMPTTKQICDIAILFNQEDGVVDKQQLANMLAMSEFILDRLYENGDIMIQSTKE